MIELTSQITKTRPPQRPIPIGSNHFPKINSYQGVDSQFCRLSPIMADAPSTEAKENPTVVHAVKEPASHSTAVLGTLQTLLLGLNLVFLIALLAVVIKVSNSVNGLTAFEDAIKRSLTNLFATPVPVRLPFNTVTATVANEITVTSRHFCTGAPVCISF